MKIVIPSIFTLLLLMIGAFALFQLDFILCLVDGKSSTSLSETWSIRGQVGDILAGISSSIAMIWLIYSIWLQKQEFRAQTNEFKIGNYLQMVNRNYTHLSLLEENLTFYINNEEQSYFRDLLQIVKDKESKQIKVALQDLISIYNQISLIKKTINASPKNIQYLLQNEFDVYSQSLMTIEFEKLLSHAYANELLIPLVPSGKYNPTNGKNEIPDLTNKENEKHFAQKLRDFFSQTNQDIGIKKELFYFYKREFEKNNISFIKALDNSRDNTYPGKFTYATALFKE